MSFLDEEKDETISQHPEQHSDPKPQQPANEYWVKSDSPQRTTQTTPNGYGQGYQPNYPPQTPPPPPMGGGYPPPNQYQQGFQGHYPPPPPPNRPNQYQYNPNSGWQQPPARPQENYQWNFEDYDKVATEKTKKKKNKGLVVFVVSIICVFAVGLISVSTYGVYNYINDKEPIFSGSSSKSDAVSEAENPANQLEIASKPQITESLPVGGKMSIPQVAKAVSPSVVGVEQYRPDMSFDATGTGSGIVMTKDGFVITNAHVVIGGTAFKVILSDGTPKDAELVGADEMTDLAVLKVLDADNLTPAVFGNSNEIEVGEQVIAIGNPAGAELAGSVTMGIVSAVNREIPTTNIPLIQTDAAINPGNSGGALVNEYGQVIGINSSKIVAEEFEGIGFAIPISEAKEVVDDIVTNGRVTGRVRLGITGVDVDEITARTKNWQMGVRIQEIMPDSALVNTATQRFDIITHINGVRVTTMFELKTELEKHKPGEQITLTLFRAVGTTKSETLDVTITLLEDN